MPSSVVRIFQSYDEGRRKTSAGRRSRGVGWPSRQSGRAVWDVGRRSMPPELAGGFVTRRGRLCGRKSRLSAEHAQARRLERCPEDRGVGAELNQVDIRLLAGDAFATDTTFSSRPPLRRTHAPTSAPPESRSSRAWCSSCSLQTLRRVAISTKVPDSQFVVLHVLPGRRNKIKIEVEIAGRDDVQYYRLVLYCCSLHADVGGVIVPAHACPTSVH